MQPVLALSAEQSSFSFLSLHSPLLFNIGLHLPEVGDSELSLFGEVLGVLDEW